MANKETTTTFKADITELNKAFKQASQQIRLANSEFKAASAGMNDWSNNANGVSAKLKQLNSNLDSEKQKLESLEKQLARTAKEYGEDSDAVHELTIKVNNQKARIASTEKEIGKYNDKLKDIVKGSEPAEKSTAELAESIEDVGEKAEKSESRLSKLSGIGGAAAKISAKALGAISVAAVGAAGAIGTASVKVGAAFDSQMSTVKSIAGATEEEFETLRAKAQEMGATTSFSATESAQALEYMAMAGWDADKMISGLPGVMNLAAASGEDLASVSDIVTDAMTALGMEAEESGRFADILAAASSSANTNVGLLGESFKYCAPVAGALKSSAKDLSIALGLMANSGIKGSQAGNSLKNALVNMSKPTDSQLAAMEDLGIEITKTNGSYKSLLEIMDVLRSAMGAIGDVDIDLVDSEGNMREYDDIIAEFEKLTGTTEGLTQAEQVRNASIIFGKQNLAGMLAIINATDDDYKSLTKSIYECSGTAEEMAQVRLDNLSGDVTLFKSALEGAGIAISNQLSPVLREFVQGATDMIPEMQDGIANFGGKIANIAQKLLPLVVKVFKNLEPVISSVIDVVADDLMPCISDLVEDILPLIQPLLELIITPAKTLAKTLIPQIVKLLGNVAKILKPVLELLTPILGVITDITSLLTGTAIAAVSSFIGAFVDGKDDIVKFTKAEQESIDKTEELKNSIEETAKKREEAMKSVDSEFDYYKKLWSELQSIVDENGKIKEGYEDRASAITGVLSDAFDIEMDITGNQIQNYKDLKDSIYDVIEAEKNKALLEAGKADFDEAVLHVDEYKENMLEAERLAEEHYKKISTREGQIANLSRMSVDQVNNLLEDIFPDDPTKYVWEVTDALPILQKDLENLKDTQSDLNQNARDSRDIWSRTESYINNYGEALYNADNNQEDFRLSMQKTREEFQTAETADLETLKLQTLQIKATLDQRTEDFKQGKTGVTQEEVELYQQLYDLALQEETLALESGTKQGQNHADGIASQAENVRASGQTIAQAGVDGANSVDYYKPGSSAGQQYASGLISAVQNGVLKAKEAINEFMELNRCNSSEYNLASYVGAVKVKIPKTATGGIVTRAQTRIVGEDGAEAIVPLEKNTKWIDLVAAKILSAANSPVYSGVTSQNNTTNNYFTQNNYSPKALSRLEIRRQSQNLLEFKGR